jgi:tetratricopeptide (TPR) repeat protein
LHRDSKTRFPARASFKRERLDEFLTHSDPELIASLRAEEKDQRRRGRWVSIGGLLLLLAGVTVLALALPGFYTPLDVARNPADGEKARSLAEEGEKILLYEGIEAARPKFRMALKFAPYRPEGWAGLGAVHHYGYQQEKAEGLLRKAVALDPGYEPALLLLGEIADASGRQDEAEALWRRCSDQTNLGKLYLRQGRFPEAARILELESRKKPSDESLRKISAAARAGRVPPQIEPLIRSHYPPSRSPLTAQGWDALNKNHPRKAVGFFEQALVKEPKSVLALNGMGWALFYSGRRQEGQRYFDQALDSQPDDPVALNGRANCLHAEGKTEEAVAIWKELDATYSGRSSGTKHLGWLYYERGDCEQAAAYFARWIAHNREDRPMLDALEKCLQKLGRQPSIPAPQTRP